MDNKRKAWVGVGLAAVVLALVLWRCRGEATGTHSAAKPTASDRNASTNANAAAIGVVPKQKPDPHTLAKGSIAGTVKDEQGAPIANATVCLSLYSNELPPDFWEEALCKPTDAQGAFEYTDLFVASYSVRAGARGYRFSEYHPKKDDRQQTSFDLHAGEHKSGVDIVLRKGGVEVTGVVNDISGGPIAHAKVLATMGIWGEGGTSPPTETDDKGAFVLWVPEGNLQVTARADGYATASVRTRAPGSVEVFMTPAGSLSGIVVDARTEQPLAGVDVHLQRTQWEGMYEAKQKRTDEKGQFRIDDLSHGRFTAIVEGKHGYGRSDGSTLVGLGQNVTGVIVRVHPTAKVVGKIVLAGTKEVCLDSGVSLHDETTDNWVSGSADDDGTIAVYGVIPGTYKVTAWCPNKNGKDKYDPIVVADKDITGLVWEVDDAAKIVGKVTTKSGAVVTDAQINAQRVGGAAREKEDWNNARTDADGTYEMRSVKTGTYRLEVTTEAGVSDKDGYPVDVKGADTITKDIVLEDGGTISGTVVDEKGKPVPNAVITAQPLADRMFRFWGQAPNKTDASGNFTVTGLRAGEYRVYAGREMWDAFRKPGTNDDARQGEKVTVETSKTVTVRLVVESQSGTIKGTVVDAEGNPVGDAFISNARESDAAGAGESHQQAARGYGWGDDKPVLTNPDGTFAITDLSPGKYTLRAFRKGGGEAFAEHVAVGTTNAKLQMRTVGSIDGTAKMSSGSLPDELSISIEDLKSGYSRSESFFRTNGHFVMHDVPAGHFHVTVGGGGTQAKLEIDLAAGEQKTGITVTLESLITLTGRVVDYVTKQPVPGMRVFAEAARGGSFSFSWSEDMDNTSDESGKFTVKRAPRTKLTVQGMAKDFKTSDYGWFRVIRDVTTSTSSTVDLGDIGVIKKRVKDGDPVGEMGLHFKELPPDTEPEKYRIEVSFIEPDGPAAKTEIKVGDVIVSVDGVDVTGANGMLAWSLMQAPPGTKLALGLARGATINLTLAPPH